MSFDVVPKSWQAASEQIGGGFFGYGMEQITSAENQTLLAAREPRFGELWERYGVPPEWERPPGYETLVRIILEQQVHLNAAKATYERLNATLPDFVPEEMLKLTDEEMLAATVSRQKRRYLRELSRAVLDGTLVLEELPDLEPEVVREKMTAIVGIGNWTVDVYSMFCLKYPDIFPPGDVAALNQARTFLDTKERDEIVKIAATWSPVRTLATYTLWHVYLIERGRTYEM